MPREGSGGSWIVKYLWLKFGESCYAFGVTIHGRLVLLFSTVLGVRY